MKYNIWLDQPYNIEQIRLFQMNRIIILIYRHRLPLRMCLEWLLPDISGAMTTKQHLAPRIAQVVQFYFFFVANEILVERIRLFRMRHAIVLSNVVEV